LDNAYTPGGSARANWSARFEAYQCPKEFTGIPLGGQKGRNQRATRRGAAPTPSELAEVGDHAAATVLIHGKPCAHGLQVATAHHAGHIGPRREGSGLASVEFVAIRSHDQAVTRVTLPREN
jgi:hypothetical protein